MIEQHVLVDAIVVPRIVRRHLIHPANLTRLRVLGPQRHRPLVVARTLVGVPRARVTRAVIEQVQRGIVGVPAPRRTAATLPLIALPRRDAEVLPLRGRIRGLERVVRDADILVRARAVRAPGLLAVRHAEGRDAATHAELTTGNSGEDHVVDDERGVRHRLALLEVGRLHAPRLLAGVRIEREHIAGEELDHETVRLRIVRETTVHDVATRNRDRIRRLLWRELPLLRCARLAQIERVHLVREGAVEIHRAADDERIALVSAQRARGHRPRHMQVLDVRGGDLIEGAIALEIVRPPGHDPLVCILGHRLQILRVDACSANGETCDDRPRGETCDTVHKCCLLRNEE